MGSNLSRRIVLPLAALALALASPGAAAAGTVGKDYSKNGATGEYAPAIVHKNYSLNGATGDYVPQIKHAQPTVRVVRVQQSPGFDWADAVVGGITVLLAALLAGVTTRRIRSRRIAAPTAARPTAL